MAILNIEVPLFKKMVMNGAINLKNNHQEVDELNVFPVPDGDTGTNMQMTVMSGVREMNGNNSDSIVEVSKSLSRGCLMGARGNSGVILSQFFRGVYVYIKALGKESLSVDEFLGALESGCKVAYKAVMEPVEGTILTVVREAAENTAAKRESFTSLEELLDFYLNEARASLANTPNLLPVLKEAGVVDSGGAGFVKIVEGMDLALKGVVLEADECGHKKEKEDSSKKPELRYFVECIVALNKPEGFNESDLKAPLTLLGHSVVCKRNGNEAKISLHTNTPGRVLEMAQKYGEFRDVKIESMHNEHSEAPIAKAVEAKPKKPFALISVCFGAGICQTFGDIGVDYVIEGGQTMNPPTAEFVKAVEAVNAENVIIIPNNGNVVMAAEQAIPLCKGTNVQVLRAKTLAQGYASLMVYDPSASMETNIKEMAEAVAHVQSGEVTYSIRDTEINGIKIQCGDYMGIANGDIVVSTENRKECTKKLLESLISEESEIVTIFYGKDADPEEVEALTEMCEEIHEDIDVELIDGGQDIYTYIIAVE